MSVNVQQLSDKQSKLEERLDGPQHRGPTSKKRNDSDDDSENHNWDKLIDDTDHFLNDNDRKSKDISSPTPPPPMVRAVPLMS